MLQGLSRLDCCARGSVLCIQAKKGVLICGTKHVLGLLPATVCMHSSSFVCPSLACGRQHHVLRNRFIHTATCCFVHLKVSSECMHHGMEGASDLGWFEYVVNRLTHIL